MKYLIGFLLGVLLGGMGLSMIREANSFMNDKITICSNGRSYVCSPETISGLPKYCQNF